MSKQNGSNGNGREETILSYAAEGATDKQIAQRMGLSFGTVDSYWRRIRRRLGASSRTDAVAIWVRKQAQREVEEIRKTCVAALRAAAERTGDETLAQEADTLEQKAGSRSTQVQPEPPPPESSWPIPSGRLYGRQKELATIRRLLDPSRSRQRLVTLWGPGGSGKTRLALAAGHTLRKRYSEAAWFVSLSSLADPVHIPTAIWAALPLTEDSGEATLWKVIDRLKNRNSPCLLVIDNLEHLLSADGDAFTEQLVSDLLDQAPNLRILTTSRRLIGLAYEQRLSVLPLPIPNFEADPVQTSSNPSVKMFLNRARPNEETNVSDADLREASLICSLMEGVPLALEIAAAQARRKPFDEVRRQIQAPLELPNRRAGGELKHRSLEKAIRWSYELLTARQQRTLRSLSVFRGGWTVDAAKAVSSDPDTEKTLMELTEHALVAPVEGHPGRLTMLETVRQFLSQQVSTREQNKLAKSHANYFGDLARAMAPDPKNLEYRQRVRIELGNFRAAWAWSLKAEPWGGVAVALHYHTARFFELIGLTQELWQNVKTLLALPALEPHLRVGLLMSGTHLSNRAGSFEEGAAMAKECKRLVLQSNLEINYPYLLLCEGRVLERMGRLDEAFQSFGEAVDRYERSGNQEPDWVTETVCSEMPGILLRQGKVEDAVALMQRLNTLIERPNFFSPENSELLLLITGRTEELVSLYSSALEHAMQDEIGAILGYYHRDLGRALLLHGQLKQAENSLRRSIDVFDSSEMTGGAAIARAFLAEVLARQGEKDEAKKIALQIRNNLPIMLTGQVDIHHSLAVAAMWLDEGKSAKLHIRTAIRHALRSNDVFLIAQCLERRAQIQDRFGPPAPTRLCRKKAEEIRVKHGLAFWP